MAKTEPVREFRGIRIQWRPNWIARERRLCLTRIRWERGTPGDGRGYSNKLSASLCFAWYDLWIGAFIKPELWGWTLYVCLLPCLPIRIHRKRAYGGIFP